jgi:integrase/recombinase XerD
MPLFPDQPESTDDINFHTPFIHTIALFQSQLLKGGKSEHTISAFTSDLHLVAERLGGDTPIGKFSTTLLSDFLVWLEHGRGVPCSRKSYARRVTTLKVYFKWLHEIGAIQVDPAAAIVQRSGPAPLSTILDERDIEAALALVDVLRIAEKPDARPALLFRLLLETGIKKSEAGQLAPNDIVRVAKGEAYLIIKRTRVKDIYKERRIPISAALIDTLDEYLRQYRATDRLFTCTTRNLEYILEDIGTGISLAQKPSFEMLRWTCAVRNYAQGVEPNAIREKLGLSKISWVETFAKIKRLAGEGSDPDI